MVREGGECSVVVTYNKHTIVTQFGDRPSVSYCHGHHDEFLISKPLPFSSFPYMLTRPVCGVGVSPSNDAEHEFSRIDPSGMDWAL